MENSKSSMVGMAVGLLVIGLVAGYAIGKSNLAPQISQTPNPSRNIEPIVSHAPVSSADLAPARATLINFFKLLNTKQYANAVELYGGSYEGLKIWNFDIDLNDHAALAKRGCEINGLNCLAVKNVLESRVESSTELVFTVQFANKDGSLFKRGPCCGSSEQNMPTQTDFEYTVIKSGTQYRVMDFPPYTP